jgi:GcrA cell cycle regulator
MACYGEWSVEENDLLRREWIEGKSASQISKMLHGRSRNACIGRIHRMGLQKREKPDRIAHVERAARRKRSIAISPVPPRVVRPARTETLSEDRQLAKLLPALGPELIKAPDGLCKFIPGDPLIDASICGRATGHGSYCVQHIRLCYEPSSKKPRVRSVRTDEKRRWLRALEREVRA